MTFRRISIIGLGLIGGSIALAIKNRISDCHVTGYDVNAKGLHDALAAGAIQRMADNLHAACDDAQCVIICVPVGAVPEIFKAIAGHLKPGVCVTDVCSTKRTVVDAAHRLLPKGVHFVGSHPMAGREQHGFSGARADLFLGAICITTPDAQTDPVSVKDVEQLWHHLGMEIRQMPADQHDHLVAQISHLPHVLASALIQSATDQAIAISGPGFRDVTRIAASDPALWQGILLDNADEVHRSITRFRTELDRLETLLDAGRPQDLRAWLAQAATRRRDLPPRLADATGT